MSAIVTDRPIRAARDCRPRRRGWFVRRASLGFLMRIQFWFCLLLGWVALVSVHDATLIVANRGVIGQVEENPVGVWLLQSQKGQVWLFVAVKLLATSIVTTAVVALFRFRRDLGLAVVTGLAIFQSSLFAYLTLY